MNQSSAYIINRKSLQIQNPLFQIINFQLLTKPANSVVAAGTS